MRVIFFGMTPPSVLFVCTHNSARSQLAEALLRHDHGTRYTAHSAGTEQTRVKPEVLQVLKEAGVDTTPLFSKTLDHFEGVEIDYVVTVCDSAKDSCPWYRGKVATVHKPFVDPSNETRSQEMRVQAFRETRDGIRRWLREAFRSEEPAL